MQIQWRNIDFIDVSLDGDNVLLNAKGCSRLLKKVHSLGIISVARVDDICKMLGDTHWELLIKEALLKITGKWSYPYSDDEICHCRMIPTKVVDEAIVGGLHTSEKIGEYCSAGITCGNCKVDIQEILAYRLAKKD